MTDVTALFTFFLRGVESVKSNEKTGEKKNKRLQRRSRRLLSGKMSVAPSVVEESKPVVHMSGVHTGNIVSNRCGDI